MHYFFTFLLPCEPPSQTLTVYVRSSIPRIMLPMQMTKCQLVFYNKSLGKGKELVLENRVSSFSLCCLIMLRQKIKVLRSPLPTPDS